MEILSSLILKAAAIRRWVNPLTARRTFAARSAKDTGWLRISQTSTPCPTAAYGTRTDFCNQCATGAKLTWDVMMKSGRSFTAARNNVSANDAVRRYRCHHPDGTNLSAGSDPKSG